MLLFDELAFFFYQQAEPYKLFKNGDFLVFI